MSPHIASEKLGQTPPSAQSASWAVRGNSTSVSTLVPHRCDGEVSNTAAVVSSAASSWPSSVAADHSSSGSTGMMAHHHDPSSSITNPAFTSASSNPSPLPPSAPALTPGVGPSPPTFFDPWNSSSTGHQRAENRLSGSTSWRSSRNFKLREQYRGGLSGGKWVADTIGPGSEEFGKDGRKASGRWEKGARGLRVGGQKSLIEVWGASKASSTAKKSLQEGTDSKYVGSRGDADESVLKEPAFSDTDPKPEKQIFKGLCFYLNGSTAPLISDHKLKHLLAAHGGNYSIALGRRTVTHVILGTTCGGGLSASKLEKEIVKKAGKGVKFISADWVLSSIAASKRLPESHFSPLKLAPRSQKSLFPSV